MIQITLHSYRLQGVGSLEPWLARRIGNIQQDAYILLAIRDRAQNNYKHKKV
jgi:hypothetical protein